VTISGLSVVSGDDGLARCAWVGADTEYRRYHDEEWGTPLHGDRPLFEKLSLEAFQSGLSWITILRKRDGFRLAFSGFDIGAVAAYSSDDVERLLGNTAIVRNRAKIVATIANAAIVSDIVESRAGAFDELIWSFAPSGTAQPPLRLDDVPASTPESAALSAELRRRGLRFVGPTTMYALMQSSGMVDDHVAGCWRAR
jgi:DNA-3-methyladenine glycosylase I